MNQIKYILASLAMVSIVLLAILSFGSIKTAYAFPPAGMVNMDSVPHTNVLPVVKLVRIVVLTANGDTLPGLVMEPGKPYTLSGSPYSLRATDFYTQWMIKGSPVNYSQEEKNPAVKIEVLKGDSLLYHRWAFKRTPFFGMQKLMGHKEQSENQLYFTLIGYEGLTWPEPKQ